MLNTIPYALGAAVSSNGDIDVREGDDACLRSVDTPRLPALLISLFVALEAIENLVCKDFPQPVGKLLRVCVGNLPKLFVRFGDVAACGIIKRL